MRLVPGPTWVATLGQIRWNRWKGWSIHEAIHRFRQVTEEDVTHIFAWIDLLLANVTVEWGSMLGSDGSCYRSAMEPIKHRIPVSDGLELNVLEWSKDGVPMILLHGGGNEAHLWDDFVPCVAKHYRVIAVDQRGHGDSDWDSEGRYDTEHLVNDLEALTDSLAIDRFVLIGFSMGGRVSMGFAGRHPERLAGLVLIDIGPELDPRGIIRIGQENQSQRAAVFTSIDEYTALLSLNYPAGQPDALIRMARHGLRQRDDGLFELKSDPKLRRARADDDAARAKENAFIQEQWDALAKIPCPTLVVRGAASDILSPDIADRMVDEVLKNGQLAIIPQAAHSVMTDNPKAFDEAVSRFVLGE